ncbi:MAG: Radical SAM domain-containing protein [Promethearchaeota archaeon]|nr:MAG: Radical SAM domain-containing protein [Candidatus Lokiarchaeota archaeon]
MEWKKEIQDLFEELTNQVPEGFRSAVKPLLHDAAEETARLKNSSFVSKDDLISALFKITPDAFQATLVNELKKLGIDSDRYIKLSKIREEFYRSWDEIGQAFLPTVYHMTIYLTDRCNMNCLHCAAESLSSREELTTEQWIEIVDDVETTLNEQGRRGCYIWFGGEPLLRKDLKDLINYCAEKGYHQAIATNGSFLDDEFAEFCAKAKMSHMFISIDSVDPEKCTKIRGIPNAYEHAKNAIQSAVKYGHFVICTPTVMKLNFDELEELKRQIEEWGAIPFFRAIIKQRSAKKNWDEIGLTPQQYKDFYDFKYENVVDAIRKGKATTLNRANTFDMVPFMETPQNDEELTALEWGVGCQACRLVSGIDVNGNFFPCDYPSELVLGNLRKQTFKEIMETQLFKDIRDRKRTGKCATCHHLELCGGGCRVHAECETGDFFASFPYCWHEPDHTHEDYATKEKK